MLRWRSILIILAMALIACEPQTVPDGPQLVREVTVAPTSLVATRVISDTPTVTPTVNSTEVLSPLQVVTVDAQFVVITPTLPPSKTPTVTPSNTPTPTITPSPTMTNTATSTVFVLPTSEIRAVTQPAPVPTTQVCDTNWQFIQPPPPSCPQGPPNASTGTYQRFPNGHMIEVSNQDAIYVLYNDTSEPRWNVYRDLFEEGMAETSPAFPPEQPVRGFGLLWRDDAFLRNRIGNIPTMRYEAPYNVVVQISREGTIYLVGTLRSFDNRYSDAPATFAFMLFPNKSNWREYNSNNPNASPPIGGTEIAPLGF